MTCPYLMVWGEGDQQAPYDHARRSVDAAGSARKAFKIFTREEGSDPHCQIDNVSIGTSHMCDWVAEVLDARR
jgi:hypothetical protein